MHNCTDYDGGMCLLYLRRAFHSSCLKDVAVVIYDKRLVDEFHTPPLTQEPPNFIQDNFEDMGTIQQVHDLAVDLAHLAHDSDEHRRMLQESLLLGLSLPPIGLYSQFHEGSAFAFGYDSPESVRHAFM